MSVLPKDWHLKPLASLVDPSRPISYGVVQTGEPVAEGIPCVRVVDLSSGKLNRDEMITTSPEISRSYRRTILREGDVIFALRGDIGKAALVDRTIEGANLTRGVALLSVVHSQTDPRFVYHALASKAVQREIQNGVNGTGLKEIPIGNLRKVHLPVPPLSEQKKIADILSTWDEALEKLDALIAAKDRRKQALMQQLLTGRKRLANYRSKWISEKLGILFSERVERGREDLPLLSITADRGIIPRDNLVKRDTSSEDKSKYLRIAPGDIGFNTMRMWQGVSALSAHEGIVSPAYTICVPTPKIDGEFAAHFFKYSHTIHLFHRYSQGLVDDTLNLKFPSFSIIVVTIPADIGEQKAIATILDTADQDLTLLRRQREALDQQKRGLMQRLLTGNLRVAI